MTAKEERIRKLKKKHIWPSILGLVLILCLFVVIMIVALALSGVDIVQRKLLDSGRQSEKVAELFAEYGAENGNDIEQTVLSHIEVIEEIVAVSVTDEQGRQLWSSNGEYPIVDDSIQMEFL
ncbi:MAG: hypothetical protein IJ274_06755, partial [Lachnospiraceae bacterium]|nr:hypothetical protein [Lachnospiraceae bacterium]